MEIGRRVAKRVVARLLRLYHYNAIGCDVCFFHMNEGMRCDIVDSDRGANALDAISSVPVGLSIRAITRHLRVASLRFFC